MAYIGKEPIVGNFQKCDAITVVNGQAAYTLQVSSTNVVPESANHMLVSLNGILQAPTTSFTISGSTLSFTSTLTSNDTIDFVILLGNVLDIGTPSDATVSNAKLASDLISGETDIGGAIADADLFLLDDGAGGTLRKSAASRIKTYVTGGITEYDVFTLTAEFANTADPIASNLSREDGSGFEVIGSGMTESSGIFTFPSTGKYLVTYFCVVRNVHTSGERNAEFSIHKTLDNSSYSVAAKGAINVSYLYSSANNLQAASCAFLFDVTNTTNCKVRFKFEPSGATTTVCAGHSTETQTSMHFTKIGDT